MGVARSSGEGKVGEDSGATPLEAGRRYRLVVVLRMWPCCTISFLNTQVNTTFELLQ